MAFSVTHYYNTYGIKTSGWMTYSPTSLNWEFTHPENDVSVDWKYTHSGLPDGTNVYFSCTVKTGFTFKYWKYYVGGSSSPNYCYDQDFVYTGGQDVIVYVYANEVSGGGGGEDDTPIQKWSWSSSNGSASDTDTINAYNALVNKTSTRNFSHLVWNDMVNKVDSILSYWGNEWDDSYLPYRNTLMTTTPYYMTANMFNSLLCNIYYPYRGGLKTVDADDECLAEYFLTLAECINNWIDNL